MIDEKKLRDACPEELRGTFGEPTNEASNPTADLLRASLLESEAGHWRAFLAEKLKEMGLLFAMVRVETTANENKLARTFVPTKRDAREMSELLCESLASFAEERRIALAGTQPAVPDCSQTDPRPFEVGNGELTKIDKSSGGDALAVAMLEGAVSLLRLYAKGDMLEDDLVRGAKKFLTDLYSPRKGE